MASKHIIEGVAEDTFVFCPTADERFGPDESAKSEFNYCPYCGVQTEDENHSVDVTIDEVFCEETTMSTYRYCPDCGEKVRD